MYIHLYHNNNLNYHIMKYEMTLISKGIKVTKVCKNEVECFKFERDMPAKYNLLFSKIPYVIGKTILK